MIWKSMLTTSSATLSRMEAKRQHCEWLTRIKKADHIRDDQDKMKGGLRSGKHAN